jgi:hypothetical protein
MWQKPEYMKKITLFTYIFTNMTSSFYALDIWYLFIQLFYGPVSICRLYSIK